MSKKKKKLQLLSFDFYFYICSERIPYNVLVFPVIDDNNSISSQIVCLITMWGSFAVTFIYLKNF